MAGGQGELHQVLEAATRALSATTTYQDDPRYLRIWLQYVRGLGRGAGRPLSSISDCGLSP